MNGIPGNGEQCWLVLMYCLLTTHELVVFFIDCDSRMISAPFLALALTFISRLIDAHYICDCCSLSDLLADKAVFNTL